MFLLWKCSNISQNETELSSFQQQLPIHSQTSFIDTSHFPLLGWILQVVLPALVETMLSAHSQ